MKDLQLSFNARKALSVHLGEAAGSEIAAYLQALAARVQELDAKKVDVTPIVPVQTQKGQSVRVRNAA
jgi:hypothetical protein